MPSVGAVIRLRIFSSVDLPAPLRPMIPIASPGWISSETSFRAQSSSGEEPEPGEGRESCRRRCQDAAAASIMVSRRVWYPPSLRVPRR